MRVSIRMCYEGGTWKGLYIMKEYKNRVSIRNRKEPDTSISVAYTLTQLVWIIH